MTILHTKTILLTGATGFLGSQLAIRLVKEGNRVIILKRKSSNLSRLVNVLPFLITYDIEDLNSFEHSFEENGSVDCVIHMATSYGRAGESQSYINETNTTFPIRLLGKTMFFKTPTFINVDTTLPANLNTYTLSKKYFTQWGRLLSRDNNVRFINAPLHVMYGGLDDNSKFTTFIIENCLKNSPEIKLTGGEQIRDFIYINDIVDALMMLLSSSPELESGFLEFEIGSGVSITLRQFVETIHKLTLSKSNLLFGSLPYRYGESMALHADTAALCSLGWQCNTNLEEGIMHSIKSMGNGNYIGQNIARVTQ